LSEIEFSNKITWLETSEIKPNDYNPNFMPPTIFNSLEDGIKQNKFFGGIIVNKNGIIIDGEHRFLALKKLGVKKIPVIVEDVSDSQAKILTIRINRERGYLTPIETGKVIQQLQKDIPLDILTQQINIPQTELALLTAMKYDPILDTEQTESPEQTWADIDTLVTALFNKIKESKLKFTEIYTISRGGLIPARLIADKLDIKTIHVDKEVPDNSLVIDDIYDSGRTFDDITKGNNTILFGTLFGRKGTKFPENSLIGQETIGNEYIVFPWDKQEYSRMQKLNS
jgi:Chromosome partitioning protein ParB